MFWNCTDIPQFNSDMSARFLIVRVLSALIVCNAAVTVSAQDGTPARIARIISQFPCSVPENGTFKCTELGQTVRFYTTGSGGSVNRIGVCLFSDELKRTSDLNVCECVERLWAELLLKRTVSAQNSLLKEYGVRMVLNGFPLGSAQFAGLDRAYSVISSMDSFEMTVQENPIVVTVRNETDVLKIYLPADRDLLFPYDKKEHEELQLRSLRASRDVYEPVDISGNAVKGKNGLWIQEGQGYLIDSLRNDVFLVRNAGGFAPVFDRNHAVESVQNMFLCALPLKLLENKTLDVRFRMYDRSNRVTEKIDLSRFLAFMRNQGLSFYCSAFDIEGSSFKVLVLMYHPVYKYVHMLTADIGNPDVLFGGGPAELECVLSSFIPQHNIKSLFIENDNP